MNSGTMDYNLTSGIASGSLMDNMNKFTLNYNRLNTEGMASEHTKLLRKTEEARLDDLFKTKCDKVGPSQLITVHRMGK